MLSDPEKRRKYDELGQNYQRWQQTGGAGGFDWSQWAGRGGPGGTRVAYGDVNDLFGDDGGFSDFFEAIFGGMAGRGAASGVRTGRAAAAPRHVGAGGRGDAGRGLPGRAAPHGYRWPAAEVKIPPGVKTGSKVRMAGEGLPAGRGGPRGDIYLIIKVLPHPRSSAAATICIAKCRWICSPPCWAAKCACRP